MVMGAFHHSVSMNLVLFLGDAKFKIDLLICYFFSSMMIPYCTSFSSMPKMKFCLC